MPSQSDLIRVLSTWTFLMMCSSATAALEPRDGHIELETLPNAVLQVEARSDCLGPAACNLQTRVPMRIGSVIRVQPLNPRSKLLVECSFQAQVQLIRELNTFAMFQIQESTMAGGSRNIGGVFSLYSILTSFGAAIGAPISLRAIVPCAGMSPRTFSVLGYTVANGQVPLLTVTDKVCSVTEIAE